MRKFLLALALLFGIAFFFTQFAEIQEVLATVRRANPRWLALAVGVQIVWLLNVAASFRSLYRLVGVRERIEHLFQVAAAANFVSVVMPSLGVGGMAIFLVDGRRRGHPTSRVGTACALWVVYDYLGFLIVLTIGLIILIQRNQLRLAELGAAAIFIGAAAVLGSLVVAGMRSAERLEELLVQMGAYVNRLLRPLLKREYLDLERAHTFANDVGEGLQIARQARGGLLLPAALALSNKALLITILFLVFLAYGQPFSVPTLVAAFSVGYLFMIVSPTPSGVGFVEGALTVSMSSMGVPLAAAGVIALTYRGITFWLPLVYGLVAFRAVGRAEPQSL
jgi:hypothetical protein